MADQRLMLGRLAGVLFSVGVLAAIPTLQLLHHPNPPSSIYLLIAVGVASGIVCSLVPWERLAPGWLHVIPVLATVEVAAGVWIVGRYGEIYAGFFAFIAVFAAYAFSDRRMIAAHLGFTSAAVALALAHVHGPAGEKVARSVVGVALLVTIAGVVTLLREGLQSRQAELEQLTLRDPLTGVGNYRLLSERLGYEIVRHERSARAFTVMLLDLDGFKEINDTLGHLVGDHVLREVARALVSAVRAQDTLARHGGDEFSVLAPETDDEQARPLAARVTGTIAAIANESITASVGCATYPADGTDAATLLAQADTRLRAAKRDRDHRPAPPVATRRSAVLRVIEGQG